MITCKRAKNLIFHFIFFDREVQAILPLLTFLGTVLCRRKWLMPAISMALLVFEQALSKVRIFLSPTTNIICFT